MKVSKYYSFGDYSASLDIEFDPSCLAELSAAYNMLNTFEETDKNADTEPGVE